MYRKMKYIFEDLSDIILETANGISRIEKIVKSLLGFARKGFESEITEYDLNKGILDTITIANNEIKYYAKVVTELGEIPIIEVFAGEINQVFLNLIVNAAHAIKNNAENVEEGIITIRTYLKENFVCCEFEDNGTGIPQNIVNRIFEPFFTTKPVGSGTGLGLSIAHDIIVDKHKGKIIVDSKLGIGTRFIVLLPINKY